MGKRTYKRETVTLRIKELLARVDKLNREVEHPEFVYTVDNLVIYGDYIENNSDKIPAAKIAMSIKLKARYGNDSTTPAKEAMKRAPQGVSRDDYLNWRYIEIHNYIVNGAIAFRYKYLHNIDGKLFVRDGAGLEEITNRCKVIIKDGKFVA